MTTEHDYVDTIIDAAKTLGFLAYHQRPAQTKQGWRSTIEGHKGFPDLVIVGHGKAWFVECKRRPRKPTAEQMAWATELIKAGLDARLCYVPEDVPDLLVEMRDRFTQSRLGFIVQRS